MQIIQILRRERRPVTASAMAEELEVSARTLYRDIVSLESTGVPIRGEAGIGYVLEDGFDMPPLMFTQAELEALMLGARLLDGRVDENLSRAAKDAISKIAEGVPKHLKQALVDTPLFAPVLVRSDVRHGFMESLRQALQGEREIAIRYRALDGSESERVVWPVLISLFPEVNVLAAWCTLRKDFRTFRLDGFLVCEVLETPCGRPRRTLYADWKKTETASYRTEKFASQHGAKIHGI